MRALKTTPWLTRNDIQNATGLKSFVTIGNLTDSMCQHGLLQQQRQGRRLVFARIDEKTPPPLSF